MRLYRFDEGAAKTISAYGSAGLSMARVVRGEGAFSLGCMYVSGGGAVGGHEAPVAQLFLVVAGGGSVRAGASEAEAGEAIAVGPGTAVFWEPGEWHETAAGEGGLTALVLECPDGLDPEAYMKSLPV